MTASILKCTLQELCDHPAVSTRRTISLYDALHVDDGAWHQHKPQGAGLHLHEAENRPNDADDYGECASSGAGGVMSMGTQTTHRVYTDDECRNIAQTLVANVVATTEASLQTLQRRIYELERDAGLCELEQPGSGEASLPMQPFGPALDDAREEKPRESSVQPFGRVLDDASEDEPCESSQCLDLPEDAGIQALIEQQRLRRLAIRDLRRISRVFSAKL